MKTRRLYQEDVYRRSCEAVVTDIAEDAEGIVLTFDQTVFFPTGGGQSCDRGTVGGLTVIDVFEDGPFVRHRCLAGGDGEKGGEHRLSIGDNVELDNAWEHRDDNMPRHPSVHCRPGGYAENLQGGSQQGHVPRLL